MPYHKCENKTCVNSTCFTITAEDKIDNTYPFINIAHSDYNFTTFPFVFTFLELTGLLFIGLLLITSVISSFERVSYSIKAFASLLCSTSCFFNKFLALSYDS